MKLKPIYKLHRFDWPIHWLEHNDIRIKLTPKALWLGFRHFNRILRL